MYAAVKHVVVWFCRKTRKCQCTICLGVLHQQWVQYSKSKQSSLYFLGLPSHQKNGHIKRDAFKNSGHSKSFGLSKNQEEPKFQIKPKIIAILRSGLKPRKAVRVLLNNRNTKSFETLLSDLTNTVKLDTGAVRKIFTLDGKPVMTLQDFSEAEVFIAYGVDKCSQDDFDLDLIEFR